MEVGVGSLPDKRHFCVQRYNVPKAPRPGVPGIRKAAVSR